MSATVWRSEMGKLTALQLVEFYQQVADGGVPQTKYHTDEWSSDTSGPNLTSGVERYRIKPTNKIIDISHFIKSGIDCEFSNDNQDVHVISALCEIDTHDPFWPSNINYPYVPESDAGTGYQYCRPRMNHKMFHRGGKRPIPAGFEVVLYFRNEIATNTDSYNNTWWYIGKDSQDIIGYEILGLADGWGYPWEQKLT